METIYLAMLHECDETFMETETRVCIACNTKAEAVAYCTNYMGFEPNIIGGQWSKRIYLEEIDEYFYKTMGILEVRIGEDQLKRKA